MPDPPQNQQEETDDIQTITVEDNIYKAAETFEDLHLSPTLLQGLYTEMKFQRPSKIQAKTLPMILKPPFQSLIAQVSAEQWPPPYAERQRQQLHRECCTGAANDVLQAHNGSGKTTCFTLAMLSRVDENIKQTQALCICPTRELVIQNLEVLQKMSRHTQIKATSTSRSESEGKRSASFHLLHGPNVTSCDCHVDLENGLQKSESSGAGCHWYSWQAQELAQQTHARHIGSQDTGV